MQRGVIFDLDGTLADTLADIAGAMDRALDDLGLPRRALGEYRRFVGDGARELVRRSLPEAQAARADEALVVFRAHYVAGILEKTCAYPGVDALLASLAAREVPMAVLSNKPHAMTVEVVRGLFPGVPFRTVLGQRDEVPKKPDPQGAFDAAAALGLEATRCLFVGDTHVDMATAVAAWMMPVGVAWGFREPDELRAAGAQHVLDAPEQLLALL